MNSSGDDSLITYLYVICDSILLQSKQLFVLFVRRVFPLVLDTIRFYLIKELDVTVVTSSKRVETLQKSAGNTLPGSKWKLRCNEEDSSVGNHGTVLQRQNVIDV